MHIEPSSVAGVELIGPDAPGFRPCMESLVGGAPAEELQAALPYSVIVRNNRDLPMVLLGIRFDIVSCRNKPYSVMHYADTLRYPEKASLVPGALRFICAEPRYTDMVLRRENQTDRRAAMNLENLATAARLTASLDCAAFTDGQFAGPDSHGAFDRYLRERNLETALLLEVTEKMRKTPSAIGTLLTKAVGIPPHETDDPAAASRRALARKLYTLLQSAGVHGLTDGIRSHRVRMPLSRAGSPANHARSL